MALHFALLRGPEQFILNGKEIIMPTKKPEGDATVLRKYFGYKEGQDLKGFRDELKELTGDERYEMAQAIRELNAN